MKGTVENKQFLARLSGVIAEDRWRRWDIRNRKTPRCGSLLPSSYPLSSPLLLLSFQQSILLFSCLSLFWILWLTELSCMGVGLFTRYRQLTQVTPLEKTTPPAQPPSAQWQEQRGELLTGLLRRDSRKRIQALVSEFPSTALTNDHKHPNTAWFELVSLVTKVLTGLHFYFGGFRGECWLGFSSFRRPYTSQVGSPSSSKPEL